MNIPQLRFSEFKGEWEKKKLGEVAKFSKGKGISKSDIIENGEKECIRYGELYTTYEETIDKVKSRTNIEEKLLVLSESNDVIIPASGETQIDIATASCVLRAGIALGGDLNIIKTKNNGVFLSYYLNSKKKLNIANLAQGISVVHLYSSQLSLLDLNLPTNSEQTKIASFLSAVDEKLQALKKKKSLLEDYKKGVIQKIFSQELRFKDKDGKMFSKWEVKKLGEVCDINPSKKELPLKFVYIDLESVESGNLIMENTISKNDAPSRAQRVLKDGDILFQTVRPYQMNNLHFKSSGNYVASTGYAQLRTKQNSNYIFQYLHTKSFVDEVIEKCTGTSYPSINSADLSKIKIPIPCLSEQTRIAHFLSSFDNKINLTQSQIEKTDSWKKGLLQKMFV